MYLANAGQVVCAQGSRDDIEQEPRRRMEEGQQMRHWKAAARFLPAGLAEGVLQGGCVRHRSARTVDQKSPMTVPPAVIEQRATAQMLAQRTHQILEDAQRQPLPGLAVGLAATSDSAQTRHMRTRGVAVQ